MTLAVKTMKIRRLIHTTIKLPHVLRLHPPQLVDLADRLFLFIIEG